MDQCCALQILHFPSEVYVSLVALILFICRLAVLMKDFVLFNTSLSGGVAVICSYFHLQANEKQWKIFACIMDCILPHPAPLLHVDVCNPITSVCQQRSSEWLPGHV
jgi:hypothetical protein